MTNTAKNSIREGCRFNEEDIKCPRFSEGVITSHMADVAKLHEKFFKEDVVKVNKLIKKHVGYGNTIKPEIN